MSGGSSFFSRGPGAPPARGTRDEREVPGADVAAAAEVFRFDAYELDLGAGELRRGGRAVPVGPQALALLAELVRHAGQVLAQDLLQARIWPEVTVREGSLRQAIFEVRQALSDEAGAPRYVRTLRGRGYRFDVPVTRHASPVAVATAPARREPLPLVGRAPELARLSAALDACGPQAGRAVVLRGAPGIGKSRLARALVQQAAARGVTCLESHTERDAGLPPFWPWIRLLSDFLAALPRGDRARYLDDAPLVSQMLARAVAPGWQVPFVEGPDQQRLYLFEELARLIAALGRDRPLLLLLEDVQWLDQASTAFLAYFAGAVPRTGALLVLTSRDVTRRENRPLAQALEALARGALNETLDLALLDVEAMSALLAVHAGGAVSDEIAAQVHALTAGNPLFAIEIARLLGRSEALRGASLLDQEHRELRAVIQKRLASLPASCLEIVSAAAVWGEEFGVAELAALLEEPAEATLARIDDATSQGFFAERTPLRFGFSHPLLGEVAYASLARVARARLHQRAGRWLEQKPDGRVPHLDALAHHFVCAAALSVDVARQAVDYAARSGERAFQATAYELAQRWYERALAASDLLADFPAARRLDLELARGESMRALRIEARDVDKQFLALHERASKLGDPRLVARAALGYNDQRLVGSMGSSLALLRDPIGIQLLEDARARLDDDDLALQARLACALAFALIYGPERARREALAQQAVALARTAGAPSLVAHTLSFVQWTCAGPFALPLLREASDELIELACLHGMREVELSARLSRIVLAIGVADLVRAESDAARAEALADLIDSPRARVTSQLLALMRAFWDGDLERAEQLTERTFAVQPAHVGHQTVYMARMGAVALLRGGKARLPQTIAQLESVLAMVPNAFTTRCSLATACAAAGRFDAARVHFEELAADDFAALPQEGSWLGDMIALADCAVRLDDRHAAERVYARLQPFAERVAFYHCDSLPAGTVARTLAELATVRGDFAAAERHLATSRALNRRLRAHMFLLYDALTEARLRMTIRAPGWRAIAATLLDDVTRFAAQAGARWLADYADELRQTHLAHELRIHRGHLA